MSERINRMDAIEEFEWFCVTKALEDQNHPSAEVGTQMSSADLISRQDAIDAIDRIGSVDTDEDREYAKAIFRSLPSAQPEIIRCKDCKYFREGIYNEEYWMECSRYRIALSSDEWFCGDAERRIV